MKTFTLVLAASLVSALWAAPVPKEKPAPFDPSGTWVTFSLSDEGQPFEGGKGNDLFQSRFEFKLSDKSAVLTLKSGRTASYTIGRLTQAVKSCRFECVSDCSPVYMRRFRVLCKREGDVLLLSLIDKYENETEKGKDFPTTFESKEGRRPGDAEGGTVLKLKKAKK